MQTITLAFTPLAGRLDGRHVTARGLHGLLFNALQRADVNEATWLHSHAPPKPFTLCPLYTPEGSLAGVQLTALTERAAVLLKDGWERMWRGGYPLRLGTQEFVVGQVSVAAAPSYADLATTPPAGRMGLRFLSPTAFKQGPGSLPLPLPANVFGWPLRVWKAFAPPELALPEGWLDWCEHNVFVVRHQIETAEVAIGPRATFTGFVGEVWFEAYGREDGYRRAWQALGRLAAVCGTGRKTTMGMGMVERMVG